MPEVLAAVGNVSSGGFNVSPDFFDRFWSIKKIHEDGNIKESITNYRDDPRFQEFVGASGRGIQNFVNIAFGKA